MKFLTFISGACAVRGHRGCSSSVSRGLGSGAWSWSPAVKISQALGEPASILRPIPLINMFQWLQIGSLQLWVGHVLLEMRAGAQVACSQRSPEKLTQNRVGRNRAAFFQAWNLHRHTLTGLPAPVLKGSDLAPANSLLCYSNPSTPGFSCPAQHQKRKRPPYGDLCGCMAPPAGLEPATH